MNRPPQLRLSLENELIIDQFAGGGGASLGMEWALGRSPDIAINHDPEAVALHSANHPTTQHYCESVWDVDPLAVTGGRPVGLMWLSPDCKHFSKAKGGKPVEKAIRGLAWIAVKWAKLVRPRVIILENVEEFQDWGPLTPENKPCPQRKGMTFRRWVKQLENAGYVVDWRELRACDYGAPTIRKRLFLVARRDGRPIVWPPKTHGDPKKPDFKASGLLPWRTAAECIDWSIPCPSIFERTKPLAPNTLKRIAAGIKRYVIDAPVPYIVQYHSPKREGDHRNRPVDEPLNTQSTENRFGFVQPFVTPVTHHGDTRTNGVDEPLRTVTGAHRGEQALIAANIARIGQTGGNGKYVSGAEEPLSTITSKAEHLVVGSSLVGVGGRAGQSRPRSTDEPAATLTAKADTVLITPIIASPAHSTTTGRGPNVWPVEEPLRTTSSVNDKMLVTPFITKFRDGSIGSAIDEPVHTITAGGKQKRPGTGNAMGIVAPVLVGAGGPAYSGKPVPVDQPFGSLTTENHRAVIAPLLVEAAHGEVSPGGVKRWGKGYREIEQPMPTVLASGGSQALIAPTMVQVGNGEREGQAPRALDIGKPIGTLVGTQKHGLVAALMAQHNSAESGTNPGRSMDSPLSTLTSSASHQQPIAATLINMRGTEKSHLVGRDIEAPLQTISSGGTHAAEVYAFLDSYYGTQQDPALTDPLHTITTKDRFSLVMVDGQPYYISDIGMRMLAAPELYRAQSFPPDYKIDIIYKGKPLPKSSQVRMCGNSVCPVLAKAMVQANYQIAELSEVA